MALSIDFDTKADAAAAGWVQRAERQVGQWLFRGYVSRPGLYCFTVDPGNPDHLGENIGMALSSVGLARYGEAQPLFIRTARNRTAPTKNPADRFGAMSDAFSLSDFDAYIAGAIANHAFLSMTPDACEIWAQHKVADWLAASTAA